MLSTHNPSTTASYDRSEPKITALPSFSELLTSIPLPTAFKPRSNSNVSTTSVNTSDSSSCIGLSSMPAPSSTQPHQQQNQHQHQHQHQWTFPVLLLAQNMRRTRHYWVLCWRRTTRFLLMSDSISTPLVCKPSTCTHLCLAMKTSTV